MAAPAALVANGAAWAEAYVASGHSTRPWAHPDIKAALLKETGEKCAYCEGKILSVAFGDVEHIRPKIRFPELVVTWENLTLACSRCNQHKGSKYVAELEFVNPYVDRIADHLLFVGPLIYAVSDRGTYTLTELGLDEPSRIESRNRAIVALEALFRRLDNAPTGYMRESLQTLIELQLSTGEYTAALRSYAALRTQSP